MRKWKKDGRKFKKVTLGDYSEKSIESLTDDEEVLREFFKHQNSPRL